MNRLFVSFLIALLSMLVSFPSLAQRFSCVANYDNATGTLNIDAVEVAGTRYVVKLDVVNGSSPLRFRLATATRSSNLDCLDTASINTTTLTIPDLTVADSFYAATLTLVAGNGPTEIDLAAANPGTTQLELTSSSKNPRLVPDAGFRIERAGLPFATVSSSGITYLGYGDVSGGEAFQSSSDGLNFSNRVVVSYSNRSVDSRRTLMPDGTTWRLYQMNQQGVMTSYISSDGNVFTAEPGTRYTAPASDNGRTGVYDLYTTSDGAVVLIYLGDLLGANNLRMAKSTDNGVNFTFLKDNVLGDANAGGSFVDNKTIALPDGRRRMFTMRFGELQSFITTDGYSWSREPGARVNFRDFASAGVTIYSLNDPVAVFDKNGRIKVYVAAATAAHADQPGNTNWAIVSATWDDNVGSGVLIAPQTSTCSTLAIAVGWNLLGNCAESPLQMSSAFNDATKVESVWKWVTSDRTSGIQYPTWAFYSPSLTDGGQAYAASKGYDILTTISGGEGFWVNAKASFTAQLPAGATVTSASFQNMTPGWHLIATGNSQTPSGFNTDLSATAPAAGVVPQNITTLWTWDNAQSRWYFYAPSLEAQGGTALTDYITAHGYFDFTSASKTLGPGIGFWVNKP